MVRYKKLARDINSNPTQYRTWVDGYSDFTSEPYTGYKSGENDFVEKTMYMVADPAAVVDFNLLVPTDWSTTKKVLPQAVSESQSAVIDGYVYLFGSRESNNILRAHVNNPADWSDTGASLPQHVYGSQLAVIDGYVYLFGGIADGYATDKIYSASTLDPLTWTDNGPLLPNKPAYSQLAILDGYAYLLGGLTDGYTALNEISYCFVTNPLTWYTSSSVLYEPLYRSQVGILNNYVCLFGGQTLDHNRTNRVYMSSTTGFSTGSWSLDGYLPYAMSNAQFVTISGDGYLFGNIDSGGGTPKNTAILMCRGSSPQTWTGSIKYMPGEVSHSQFAIIYDRMFFFGGNGSSVIFATNPQYKYLFTDPRAIVYGNKTRTVVNATLDDNDLFKELGFPYWKTDYKK